VIFLKATEPLKSLEEATALARKAIETDPDFGMGHATLALAYVLSGKREEGLTIARRAIAVQPGDAFGQWLLGVNLVLAGKPDEAIAPLTKALRLDPVEPRTPYRNVLGIAHYAVAEYATTAEILEQNLKRGGPPGPHMDIFRAAAYVELGQVQKAQEVIDHVLLSQPRFPVEKWLTQFLGSGDSFRTTMDNLHRLGLPPNE
jgi:tetratricopeptide (TPR) repeat protein